MKNIALGRYIPYNTIIHRIDPRVKLLCLVGLLVAIFFNLTFWEYGFLLLVVLFLLLLSKVKVISVLKSLKPMWIMMVLLCIMNLFLMKTGDVMCKVGSLTFYWGAIYQTLKIVLRLVLMISLTTILTSTTKPLDLTFAVEWYFTPLKIIKFPAHEIAMTISIALRFIPTLLEETEKIMKAQASRGIDITNGKLKEKITGVVSLIIPLFVSSFQRAEELADAMEARGYNPTGKRTRYHRLTFHYRDLIGLLVCAAFVFITIYSVYHPEIAGSLEIWK